MQPLCRTPAPPYYAVIFATVLGADTTGYGETARRVVELAAGIDGFLGLDSARDAIGITVSYWRDRESIRRWRDHAEHKLAQEGGRARWYSAFSLRIAKVEEARFFGPP